MVQQGYVWLQELFILNAHLGLVAASKRRRQGPSPQICVCLFMFLVTGDLAQPQQIKKVKVRGVGRK